MPPIRLVGQSSCAAGTTSTIAGAGSGTDVTQQKPATLPRLRKASAVVAAAAAVLLETLEQAQANQADDAAAAAVIIDVAE